jgi:hypothetical protein
LFTFFFDIFKYVENAFQIKGAYASGSQNAISKAKATTMWTPFIQRNFKGLMKDFLRKYYYVRGFIQRITIL